MGPVHALSADLANQSAAALGRLGRASAASDHSQVKGTEEHASSSSHRVASCAALAQPESAPEPALGVLACRMAGSLMHHEPGWPLPRFSVLARHFGVTTEQVAAAVDQLADRRLVRRQPGGHFSRLSPAEYHIPLPAQARLRTAVIPVGALTCRATAISRERLRDGVAWALGATRGETGCVLKVQYAIDGEPAGLSTTHVTADFRPFLAKLAAAELPELLPLGGDGSPAEDRGGPRSVQLEMQQLSPGAASLIHLAPGEKAIVITARVDERDAGGPAALTVAILRPDLFRVTIGSADTPLVAWRDYSAEGEQSADSTHDF